MLVGSEEVIRYARWIRKSIGGGMRQTGPIVNAAWTAYRELFPDAILETHRKAKVIEVGTSVSSPVRFRIRTLNATVPYARAWNKNGASR